MPYDMDTGWIAVSYGDVNQDGVLDVIVPGEVQDEIAKQADSHQQELLALDGKTGQPLWRKALPTTRDLRHAFSDLPPPLMIDLDDDGQMEMVLLTFSGQTDAVARLQAIEGQSGQSRWSSEFTVPGSSGQLSNDVRRAPHRPRPMALRTAARLPLICLNLWDGPERVVVVDAEGKTVTDFRLHTERGFHRGDFRVWACDADRDGNDDLILTHHDQLMAIRPRIAGTTPLATSHRASMDGHHRRCATGQCVPSPANYRSSRRRTGCALRRGCGIGQDALDDARADTPSRRTPGDHRA